MYRLFALNHFGELYQFGSRGWVLTEGTNFPTLADGREFVFEHIIPDLPNTVDAFFARVDASGIIDMTFAILPMKGD